MKELLTLLLSLGLGFNALAVKDMSKDSLETVKHKSLKGHKMHHKGHHLTKAEKIEKSKARLRYKEAVAKALTNDKADAEFVAKANKNVEKEKNHLARLESGKETFKHHDKRHAVEHKTARVA